MNSVGKVLLSEVEAGAEAPRGSGDEFARLDIQARKNLEILEAKLAAYRALVGQYRQDLRYWHSCTANDYAQRRVIELDAERGRIESL